MVAKLCLGTVNARLELADATPAYDAMAVLAGREVILWRKGASVKVACDSDRSVARWAARSWWIVSGVRSRMRRGWGGVAKGKRYAGERWARSW